MALATLTFVAAQSNEFLCRFRDLGLARFIKTLKQGVFIYGFCNDNHGLDKEKIWLIKRITS